MRVGAAGHDPGQDVPRDAPTPWLGVPPHATLKEHHAKYLEDRGVDSRRSRQGFWTARKPSEVPEVFTDYQQRGTPALIAAFYSPDGETVGYQMRRDYPRKGKDGKTIKWMSPPGERARMVLGTHPGLLDEVRYGSSPLWSVEGVTRMAALASFGIPAVAFAGCFGWQKDGEPLECWRHVKLRGRQVLVAFDADYRTNEQVHEGLRRHVAFLEGQGARPLVVDVPEVDGDPNTGLDDWIAANGRPTPLEQNAQPFKSVNVARERLNRNERLRRAVAWLWGAWREMRTVTRGECTDRSTTRELIREAERRGKMVKDGVEVSPSLRTLAQAVRVSPQAQRNSLGRLEEAGSLRPSGKPRKKNEAQAYVLLTPSPPGSELGRHNGGCEEQGRKEVKETQGVSSHSQAESSSRVNLTRSLDRRAVSTLAEIPELRWPTILRRQERDERGRLVEVYEYLARLGKKRREIVVFVLEAGGVSSIPELLEHFAGVKTRRRDFLRDTLKMLTDHPAILLVEGDAVSLTPRWREAFEYAREVAGEPEANRLQAEKIARQRKAFRRRHEHQPDPEPEMPQVDDMRDHWSRHPDGCACRECEERFGRVIGEHPKGCRCARCFSRLKEAAGRENPNRRVVPLQPRKRPDQHVSLENEDFTKPPPAPVVELRPDAPPATVAGSDSTTVDRPPESPPKPPPKVDSVFVHGPLCECDWCDDAPEPSHARPVGGTA